MAKTSSKDLFELVHALTKAEKANFKLVSAAYKNNQGNTHLIFNNSSKVFLIPTGNSSSVFNTLSFKRVCG